MIGSGFPEKVIKQSTCYYDVSIPIDVKSAFLGELDEICDERQIDRNQAFRIWVCEEILGISGRDTIDEAVNISQENNYGIDIFHIGENIDREDSYVCWAHTIFTEDLNYQVTKKDIELFVQTIDMLENPPSDTHPIFKQKAEEFRQIGGTESVFRKKMIFVVTGKLDEDAQKMYKDPEWRLKYLSVADGASIDFNILDLDKIISTVKIQPTPDVLIKFDKNVMMREDAVTGKKSIMGHVNANNIVDIVKKNKETMFLENPREALGKSTPTNKKILETLNDPNKRQIFWKLNNGITATCDDFSSIEHNPNNHIIKNFKIVNGRQTTYTLENSNAPLDDVYVFMTIHVAIDSQERTLISDATNTQNAIKPVDLITNSPEISQLVLECKNNYNDFYFERQTKGFKAASQSIRNRVSKRRMMEKNHTARAYYAYAIDPNEAMKTDKDFFSQTNPVYYNQIFRDRTIRDLIIPHIFMSIIRYLHAEWKKIKQRERDSAIISKDIVKYYMLHFIHNSLSGLDNSQRISIEDKLIERFRKLQKNDDLPHEFIDLAEKAYSSFMLYFNHRKEETWPKNTLENSIIEPSPYQIMYQLKKYGKRILPSMMQECNDLTAVYGDQIQQKLKAIQSKDDL